MVGIGVVAGNVPLEQGVQNALYTATCAVRRAGLRRVDRPIVLPLSTAQHVHGQDGMGDIGLPLANRTRRTPSTRSSPRRIATPVSSRS